VHGACAIADLRHGFDMENFQMDFSGPSLPRLMIADDDAVIRLVLSMSLSADFEIVGMAGDAVEAIELARTSQPDVALVDVEMPRDGGLRAVAGILQVAPLVAIVALSVDESAGIVRELITAGAVAYCRKGITPETLAESLVDAIAVHLIGVERARVSA
jgi:DNA-binding NarL/FixJ family response regulator